MSSSIQYRESHKEEIAAYMKAWRQRNLEKKRAQDREYCRINAERQREKARKWREENIERAKATQRAAYVRNRNEIIARSARWAQANRERISASSRARYWRAVDVARARSRIQAEKRKALRMGAAGSYALSQWQQKVRYYGNRCYYCKKSLPFGKITQDHAIPLIRGGSNFIANILPACESCNKRKARKTVFEFTRVK